MNCPSCGAAMHLKADAEFFVCEYCGNVHFPEPNSDGVRVLEEAASVRCPVCAVPLFNAAISGHRIQYCNRCHGMLIEMDIFMAIVQDLRARRQGSADAARQPDWKDLNRRLKCPRCGQQMDTHPYYGPGNVIIDDCERCLVNWLDYSELDRIVRAPDRQYGEPAPLTTDH
jgi:Zn-finger nucleic acid-binding protein